MCYLLHSQKKDIYFYSWIGKIKKKTQNTRKGHSSTSSTYPALLLHQSKPHLLTHQHSCCHILCWRWGLVARPEKVPPLRWTSIVFVNIQQCWYTCAISVIGAQLFSSAMLCNSRMEQGDGMTAWLHESQSNNCHLCLSFFFLNHTKWLWFILFFTEVFQLTLTTNIKY